MSRILRETKTPHGGLQKFGTTKKLLARLTGKRCWYVSCGRNVGSSFELCLGEMVLRTSRLNNKIHPRIFQQNEPEYSLLVWCDWRLSRNKNIIVTNDDCDNNPKLFKHLQMLRGSKIQHIELDSPFYDFTLYFNKGWQLDVFCNLGNKKPSIDTNWELFVPGRLMVGV